MNYSATKNDLDELRKLETYIKEELKPILEIGTYTDLMEQIADKRERILDEVIL